VIADNGRRGCAGTDVGPIIDDMTTPTPLPAETTAGAPASKAPSLMHRLSIRFGSMSRPLAGTRWFSFWAVLGHQGRTSGTPYETPIVALRRSGAYLIPMPFGDSTQWAKNVLAARGGRIRQGGRTVAIDRPEVLPLDVAGAELPAIIRFLSRRFGIRQYMRVRRVEAV
jgi:deazaflavin-dependent oxidoreductase (nitroreductase family)